MKAFMDFITANQALFIVAIVALTYVAHRIIEYKAKSNPAFDKWDQWLPTSEMVTDMVFRGAEWYGRIKEKTGDDKLLVYLQKLQEFEKEFGANKTLAVQKLAAWYLSLKAKAVNIAPNPSTELPPVGRDDVAEPDSTFPSKLSASAKI